MTSNNRKMSPAELSSAIDALWNGNQSQAARELGLSSSRRIREYLRGDRSIPAGVADDIRATLALFPEGRKTVNPITVICVLQSMMVRNGYKPDMAASSILGAAYGNARAAGLDPVRLINASEADNADT